MKVSGLLCHEYFDWKYNGSINDRHIITCPKDSTHCGFVVKAGAYVFMCHKQRSLCARKDIFQYCCSCNMDICIRYNCTKVSKEALAQTPHSSSGMNVLMHNTQGYLTMSLIMLTGYVGRISF